MVVHVYNVRLCMYSLCVHARSYLSVCVCICVCVLTCMHVIVYMHVHMHMVSIKERTGVCAYICLCV